MREDAGLSPDSWRSFVIEDLIDELSDDDDDEDVSEDFIPELGDAGKDPSAVHLSEADDDSEGGNAEILDDVDDDFIQELSEADKDVFHLSDADDKSEGGQAETEHEDDVSGDGKGFGPDASFHCSIDVDPASDCSSDGFTPMELDTVLLSVSNGAHDASRGKNVKNCLEVNFN